MFRVPDYNGMYTDSIGALFLRGDNGSVSSGKYRKIQLGILPVRLAKLHLIVRQVLSMQLQGQDIQQRIIQVVQSLKWMFLL